MGLIGQKDLLPDTASSVPRMNEKFLGRQRTEVVYSSVFHSDFKGEGFWEA